MRLMNSIYEEPVLFFARDQILGWFRENLTGQIYLTSGLTSLSRIDKNRRNDKYSDLLSSIFYFRMIFSHT